MWAQNGPWAGCSGRCARPGAGVGVLGPLCSGRCAQPVLGLVCSARCAVAAGLRRPTAASGRALLPGWAPPNRREHRAHGPGCGGPRAQCTELTPLPSPKDLVNIEMFLTAKEVEESLERRETATCLAWCHDNKSRLRKMKVCGRGAGLAGAERGLRASTGGNQRFFTCWFRVLCFRLVGWGCGVSVLGKIPEKCTPSALRFDKWPEHEVLKGRGADCLRVPGPSGSPSPSVTGTGEPRRKRCPPAKVLSARFS